MLINLTSDPKVLEFVASDDRFVGILLGLLVVCALPTVGAGS
jgi:hypothetical protein